jgi:Pyridine nucleotide-disulphide oxidoreductase, dimerisation domain
MACVGLTRAGCILRYSIDGFDTLCARDEGTDRADMERNARDSKSGFVELRAQRNGRILGCTACGPASAEICNSIGIAITNRLTVSDVALAAHSYPSHGYLMYRVALSMALGRIWGLLDACGPIGRSCSSIGRRLESFTLLLRRACRLPGRRDQARRHRQWQSEGATRALIVRDVDSGLDGNALRWISYLELWQNSSLQTELLAGHLPQSNSTSLLLFRAADADSFLHWQSAEP